MCSLKFRRIHRNSCARAFFNKVAGPTSIRLNIHLKISWCHILYLTYWNLFKVSNDTFTLDQSPAKVWQRKTKSGKQIFNQDVYWFSSKPKKLLFRFITFNIIRKCAYLFGKVIPNQNSIFCYRIFTMKF